MFKNTLMALGQPRKTLEYAHAYFFHVKMLAALFKKPVAQIQGLYRELAGSDFMKNITAASGSPVGFGQLSMLAPFRAPALYVITRLAKPEIVVETGVANGFTSSFILYALQVNNKGRLHSIDLPNQPGQLIEHETGWLVPNELRARWELIIGSSSDTLGPLCKKLGTIDMFSHDSLHSYENMMFEFGTTWDFLVCGGILLADDITDNRAFQDFVRAHEVPSASLFKLGVTIKDRKK